jgi:Mrp family chromosome partitioning ATPase
MSIALLIQDQDSPIIWRGPLKMAAIKQFLSDVDWGNLDYLIIDSPPGTGDEPLSTCQLIPDITGAVIVTTPQDVAVLDSRKTVMFARQLHVPVIGIIENMSGFICPHCGKKTELFGRDGGKLAADDLKVPFLGRVPLDPEIVKHSDAGKPFIHLQKDTETGRTLDGIVESIIQFRI